MGNHESKNESIPFTNLCSVLKPILLETGNRGLKAMEHLQSINVDGNHILMGIKRLRTPYGTLRISANRINGKKIYHIALDITKGMGYVSGELYKHSTHIPESVAAMMIGKPLSCLCETPKGFPGADNLIDNIRRVVTSTRIRVDKEKVTLSLSEFKSKV